MTTTSTGVDAGLIDSIDLPIVVVGRDSTVAGYNLVAAQFFSLSPSDVGRSVSEIPFLSKVKRLEELCANAITRGTSARGEVRDAAGSWFVLSIAPYKRLDQQVSGAVLTLTNVTAFRASLEQAVYERQYTKDIINTVSDALVVVDDELHIQSANQAFHALFDISRETFQGLRLTDLGNAEWAERLRESVNPRSPADPQSDAVEVEREFPAAGRRVVLLRARPLSHQGGRAQMTLVSIQDVTVRKRAEETLARRRAQFETLLNHAPLGVYLVDADFRIRQVNPTAQRVFGEIPGLIGREFGDVMHILWPDAYADEMVARFRHTLETGETYASSERGAERRDRGVQEFYEWRINRIQLPEGSHGVVCYFRDISAQVKARLEIGELLQQAEIARSEAERANQAKDRFLAVLSHELRTPVAALLLQIALLRRQVAQRADIEQTIDAIERIARIKARLNDDLLDVSRIVAGKLALESRPVSIPLVVREAVDLVKGMAEQKSLVLESDLDQLAGPVLGDSGRLRQAICNLLTNAVKFTPDGGRVFIRSSSDADCVTIQVTDTGIGFEPDALRYLFDPFSQSEGNKNYGGLGLGLTIARYVVEGHQGTVRAASQGKNRGASFTITLPVAVVRERNDESIPGVPGATPGADRLNDSAGLAGLRILVVEDDAATREPLVQLLESTGAEVSAVSTVAEAIGAFPAFAPDLLVSDISMQFEDGYSLIRKVRGLGPHDRGQVPALAFSALASEADRNKAIAAGFDEHLAKPVRFERLVSTLVALYRKRSSRPREAAGALSDGGRS